ncbi:MAG: TolC family protein [Candidatus Binatia bacterium]
MNERSIWSVDTPIGVFVAAVVLLWSLVGGASQNVVGDATRPRWSHLPPLPTTRPLEEAPKGPLGEKLTAEQALGSPLPSSAAGPPEPHALPKAPAQPRALRFTLEMAINRALTANRGIGDAADRVTGSRYSLAAAAAEFELKIIPGADVGFSGSGKDDAQETLGAGVVLQKKFSTGTEVAIGPSVKKRAGEHATGVDVTLTQPLLRGFNLEHNLSGIYAAEYAARSARRSLYITQVDTVLWTVSGVYEVVRQRELVRLNEASAERLRGHAEAARVKGRIGLSTLIDVYRAGIQLKRAEDNLATAREAYRDALDNLKIIFATPLEQEIEVEAPLEFERIEISEASAVALALKNRVELRQAEDTLDETMRKSRVARHNTLPELNVVLNYSRFGSAEDFGQSTRFDEDNWNVGLMTSTDIARTAERAAYEQSLLALKAANRSLGLKKDEVARQVKRELRNLRRADKRITIQQEQIKQAEGKLELSRIKFSRGLANNFDVIEAESELRQAQTSLLSAVTEYIVGSYRLRAVLGTLLEKPSF